MELVAVARSAPKRKYTEADVRHAARYAITQPIPDDDGLTMVTGPIPTGELIEIGMRLADDGWVAVHAMKARDPYLPQSKPRPRKPRR